jgi:hypothetical protein
VIPPTPTTLTVAMTNATLTATVASTNGFPAAGTIQIDGEQMTYTALGAAPPRFRNLTRNTNGAGAAAHAIGATVSLVLPFGQIPVNDPRHNIEAVAAPPTAQQWATRNAGSPPDTPKSATQLPMHYTFNTPVGAAPTSQCGRGLFSDFHVYAGVTSGGTTFPNECGAAAPMTPQEKLLEFMLFDLTGCIVPDTCVPKTCKDYGYTCGTWPDGCGGLTADCGDCTPPATCGGGGVMGMCGGGCAAQTCASLGFKCGVWGDGCGGVTPSCGDCTPGFCGSNGMCEYDGGTCAPQTCVQQNIGCGPAGDGCGHQIDCGMCTPPAICSNGGGGVIECRNPMCTPQPCPAGANCGVVADGCGGTVSCGTCTPPETCGGGGVANVCGLVK